MPALLLRVHLVGGPDDGQSLERLLHPGETVRLGDRVSAARPGDANVPLIFKMQPDGSLDILVRIDRDITSDSG